MTESIIWRGMSTNVEFDLTDPSFGLCEAAGIDFGSPVPLTTALARFLLDGEIVAGDRSSNRTLNLTYHAKRANSSELAKVSETLAAIARQPRGQIIWATAGDPSNPTVFDTFRSSVVRKVVPGDPGQLADFQLTIPAMPFVHPKNRVVIEALSSGAEPENDNVDTCATTANWTASHGIHAAAGAVYTFADITSPTTLWLDRAITLDLTDTPYLSVDWRVKTVSGGPFSAGVRAFVDGSRLELVGSAASPTSGYERSTFRAPASLAITSSLEIRADVSGLQGATGVAQLEVASVDRTNTSPASGTTRQRFRSAPISGSQRSPGRLELGSDTAALGQVLLYTRPDDGSGYVPVLRPWRVSGGTVIDQAANVSGKQESLAAGATFLAELPANLLPAGNYHLLAKFAGGGAMGAPVNISWAAVNRINSTDAGHAALGTVLRDHQSTSRIVPIASLYLPPDRLPDGTTATTRIAITPDQPIDLDEVWVVEVDSGAYSLIDCGTGTPVSGGASVSRLRIDPADSDRPEPTILGGFAEDWTDAHFIGNDNIDAWSDHPLEPGRMMFFSVTTNATDADVRADYYPLYQDQVI